VIKRRPLLVTPWAIWLKPGLKIRYIDILFFKAHGTDERGRQRLQIVDEMDREYWTRLNPVQFAIFRKFA